MLSDDIHIACDIPYKFGSYTALKSSMFVQYQNMGKIGAHIFQSDCAVVTELAQKWSPFHVLCDDLHIVGDTPYRYGLEVDCNVNLGKIQSPAAVSPQQ